MNFVCLTIFVLSLNLNSKLIECRGRMIDPPQRGSMWRYGFSVASNYNDMSDNNCGGVKQNWEVDKKCGLCGDPFDMKEPRDHEIGGKYGTGIIGKTYAQGQIINVTIDITANHVGYFEFRLCQNDDPMNKVDQTCFDKNLLVVLNNNEELAQKVTDPALNKYKYFLPDKGPIKYYVSLQLPDELKCKACVLQWRYRAGNNVGQLQEEIFNCADIEILDAKLKMGQNDTLTVSNLNSTVEMSIKNETTTANLTSRLVINFNLIFILISAFQALLI